MDVVKFINPHSKSTTNNPINAVPVQKVAQVDLYNCGLKKTKLTTQFTSGYNIPVHSTSAVSAQEPANLISII